MDGGAAADWRSELPPEARMRIVNKIMETLKKHLPVTVPEGLNELQKIAVRFEDKIYSAAKDQPDYLRRISLKMLSMDTKSQNSAVINPSLSNSAAVNQNTADSVRHLLLLLGERRKLTTTQEQKTNSDSMDGGAAAADWRSQLHPEARMRIVNKILESLKKHLPVTVPEGLIELQNIAIRFEDRIYTTAQDQTDYLRKISLKMLSMDKNSQNLTGINPSLSNSANTTDSGTTADEFVETSSKFSNLDLADD